MEAIEAALHEIERAVVGKRDVLEIVMIGLLAGGHLLIEDVPGQAKTLIARSFAQVTDLSFGRIQFTPDLIPADVTGSALPTGGFNAIEADGRSAMVFQPGPIFANLVLGDEINRAPPKTQAALLEAMEERQVTVDGISHLLPSPFMVIATQNPIEADGTYPLPAAQLDRFLIKTSVGYPSRQDEEAVLRARVDRGSDSHDLRTTLSMSDIVGLQTAAENVAVDDDVISYVTAIARATRGHQQIETGASTRGSISLVRAARARALLNRRDFVVPTDVKALAEPVLAHRLVTTTEAWVRGVSATAIVQECLDSIAVPEALTPDDREALGQP
jgi:MoxR-like ATPase